MWNDFIERINFKCTVVIIMGSPVLNNYQECNWSLCSSTRTGMNDVIMVMYEWCYA